MSVKEFEVISKEVPERLHIEMPRRAFLLKLGFLLNGIAATLVSVPVLGYLLSSFRNDGGFTSWITLGSLATFPENQTRIAKFRNPYTRAWDGQTADIPCWVRRMEGDKFQIFAINCTHLGCPVRWFQESHLFMCPCHGGAFYEDGSHASGPPPRGLYEYKYKIENGQLWIYGGQLPTLNQPT
jgi:quinol---cytochrome c reductase iron-sulfur subunit, bacillus type